MDTVTFLRRVLPAQGNYFTVQWKNPTQSGATSMTRPRSYKPDQVEDAAKILTWASRKGADAYFAVAAYNLAEATVDNRGTQIKRAKREQSNVHLIKVLVADADVKREGDGKDPAHVFPDRRSAVQWIVDFAKATGLPLPNLAVNSGYGIHFYWVLDDALSLDAWQPLANALKAAMLAHGWMGDTAPTVDGARILRPPGTLNYKTATPMPVAVFPKFTAADYPNAQIEAALAPWISIKQQSTGTHGGATVTQMGPRPSHIPGGNGAGLNKAAQAGFVSHWKFSEIAKKCEQVKKSMASGGNGESYPLWYLGHISLAAFTQDGKDFIHPISAGDARYDHANVETKYAQAENERDTKGFGAPLCSTYDAARPGVCGTCPFQGKYKSPIGLGVEDVDLPYKYRRVTMAGEPRIERYAGSKEDGDWVLLFVGDVSQPRLDALPTGGHKLTFAYTLAGKAHPIAAMDFDMGHMLSVSYFAKQGMSVTRHTIAHIGDFVMAWIEKLRLESATQDDLVRSFGWNFNAAGGRTGLAIAGTLYRVDGNEEAVPGGDPKIAAMYRPMGDIANWRKAAALFEGGRPDLQALIAVSFGAPLVSLCGDVRGMTMNFHSIESGVGKSTAVRVAQSIWGDFKTMQSMNDTPNAVMRSLSEPRVLPRFWDEMKIRKDQVDDFVNLIFTIPQGKERARMMADTTLREVGEWETLLVLTSNRSFLDYLMARDDGTDAGVARLLEVSLSNQKMPFDPLAGQIIKLCETNYGHAGRAFIKYVTGNLPVVQAQLASVLKSLADNLAMQREERFLATGIACTIVGASIARKLGLFNFDTKGITETFLNAVKKQRGQRGSMTIVSATGGYNLEEIVSEFVNSQADYRIRTSNFAARGVGKVDIIGHPPRGNLLKCHIAEALGVVRVSRSSFVEWLRAGNRPANEIEDGLLQMGATVGRKTLGGGTGYGGGAAIVAIDIPLTSRLAGMTGSASGASGARPSPADAARDAAD